MEKRKHKYSIPELYSKPIFIRVLILLFSVFSFTAAGQSETLFWVYLNDKPTIADDFSNPFDLFSPRAVERKARLGIDINPSDLRIPQAWTSAIREDGHEIVMISKWLNALLVSTQNPESITKYDFVNRVEKKQNYRAVFSDIPEEDDADFAYGSTTTQFRMVNGDYLHDRGLAGENVLIAVFDGGYHNAQNIPAFDSLRMQGRLKGTYSFVLQDSNIYQRGSHGTHVLSIMAGFQEGIFVGSAPRADYWLFMTEDEIVEVNAEEYNWLAAAEVSDSLGVDIINSSLGYSTFDPGENSYTTADLDGQIGVVTQAAVFAAQKGILVVNSAGNAGSGAWEKILKPADADSILTVGAVTVDGSRANFSSLGPTVDGRIKPDVMAMGDQAYYVGTNGFPNQGNGTSFSAPIIAGFAACLRQAYPNHSTENIRQTILQSAHLYFTPDTLMGYGIPDFSIAYHNVVSTDEYSVNHRVSMYPNPAESFINLSWDQSAHFEQLRIFDLVGNVVLEQPLPQISTEIQLSLEKLPIGKYLVYLYGREGAVIQSFIKSK
ncbi:MAG: S8 family serine peptidase [Cryomorphaceae bacterium]|nr:S8 family serine peptidase [Cryomorphaceae bacterium]